MSNSADETRFTLRASGDGVQRLLLVAALFGLGTGIRATVLRRTGGRAVVLGLVSWPLVAVVSYLGVRWFVA